MALELDSSFGRYRIGAVIGEGGMGQVYLATDMTLERKVAIKVLPASFASDADRVARFEREAKTLAALNHNNIAQIYGIEKGAVTAIVMELVEGPTLADRIAEGPLPPEEALRIARQIIDGLEAAHDKGIVHRDLKPANIKVTADGLVKILDFGIAKSIIATGSSSGGKSPTMITPAVTEAGVIMGTAAYMSPEQARGKFVDQRTDIWAFGCVLYEMLTGQPVFIGEDVMIVMASILRDQSDLTSIPSTISPAVRHAIKLCLEKDPKKRLHHIGDVRLALQGDFESGSATLATSGVHTFSRRLLSHAATLLVGGVLVALGVWQVKPEAALVPQPLNRFAYSIPNDQSFRGNGSGWLAVSPDGRHFAYNTSRGLYVRTLGELEAQLIPGTEADLDTPFFSPDSKFVAYFSVDGQLRRAALGGGSPIVVATGLGTQGGGASWTPADTILMSQNEGIYRVSANGGIPELLIPSQAGEEFGTPELLPDGDTLLFNIKPFGGLWDTAQVVAQSLVTGQRTVLVQAGSNPRYLSSGHLVYAQGDTLFAVAFDPTTLSVRGGAVPMASGLQRATITDSANYGIAGNGTLVYVSNSGGAVNRVLVWMDREGHETPINAPPRNYQYAQLSPDGTRIALDSRDEENDIWIYDLTRETLQRLTFDPGLNRSPLWSPDGKRVAFTRQRNGTEDAYWQAADGSGEAEALTTTSAQIGQSLYPTSFTPDGATLIHSGDITDLLITPVADPAATTPLLNTAANENGGALSPDGRWFAYQSDESGRNEIYVRPFPDISSGRWQISTEGGTHPDWAADGSELFYMDLEGDVTGGAAGALMAVPVMANTSFQPGKPTQLFAGNFLILNRQRLAYDVASDGRFLMIKNADGVNTEDSRREIIIVQNFVEELQRLVPAP